MIPLTALFVDCDSFFASVEQHLDPRLRGRPVGVAPVLAETSCCIAASYEAKKYGVKTGTGVREARQLCPGIVIVEAKHSEYVKVHHRVVEAVEDCIHVEAVLSIDEMWAWLPYNWRDPGFVEELGVKIKRNVERQISPSVKVSVGAGPNKYLAKLASKLRKPDGLYVMTADRLPDALHQMELSDLTGVGRSMELRIRAAGIHTVADLCAAPRERLHAIWGGVLGDRLWHLLRGVEIPDLVTARKSIGHSHVLAPDLRKPASARDVLCKLLHKACERLRHHGMMCGHLSLNIGYWRGPSWTPEIRFPETESTVVLMRLMDRLWRERPDPHAPLLQVAVTLGRLVESHNYTPDLFSGDVARLMAEEDGDKHARLDAAIDGLRARYGRQCVYFGTAQQVRDAAPMRISFTHIPDERLER